MGTEGTPFTALRHLSPRAKAALGHAGIKSLEQAATMTDEELVALPGMGFESVKRLRDWQNGHPEVTVPGKDREEFRQNVYRDFLMAGRAPAEARAATDEAVAVFYGEAG
jgi:hypothetical protein